MLNKHYRDRRGHDGGKSTLMEALGNSPGNILVLCKGNICRSPFLAEYLNQHSEDIQTVFRSVGLRTTDNKPSPPEAVTAAKQWGVDLSQHGAQNITAKQVAEADLVIGMEPVHHFEFVMSFFSSRKKFHLCGELADDSDLRVIEDPFDQAPEAFEACFKRLALIGDRMLKALKSTEAEVK